MPSTTSTDLRFLLELVRNSPCCRRCGGALPEDLSFKQGEDAGWAMLAQVTIDNKMFVVTGEAFCLDCAKSFIAWLDLDVPTPSGL